MIEIDFEKVLSGEVILQEEFEGDEITFRYPRMADLNSVLSYINDIIDEGADITFEENICREEESSWLSDTLNKIENRKCVTLIVVKDGEVLGVGNVDKKEKTRSHVGSLGISLHESVRGKGVGKRLMDLLVQEARSNLGVEILVLDVYSSNERALRFYKKYGLEKVGEIENGIFHEGKYKDHIIMKYDLGQE